MTVRRIDGRDLAASLRQAQEALLAAGAGASETWVLPGGEHLLAEALALGADDATLTIRGDGTELAFSLGLEAPSGGGEAAPGGAAAVTALSLSGATVVLDSVVVRAAASARLTALEALASGRATVRDVRLEDLRGAAVTALSLAAAEVDLAGCRVAGVLATAGEVTAIRARGAAGSVRDVSVSGLRAASGTPVALDLPAGFGVSGVAVERDLGSDELLATLRAAQERLRQSPPGTTERWRLPAGSFELDEGLELGVEGRGLQLLGTRAGGAATELVVGAGGPFSGDLVAVDLAGSRVSVDELTVRARATGTLAGVRVRASEVAELSDVQVRDLRAAAVVGVDVQAPAASLVDVTATRLRAAAGPAVGAVIAATRLSLSRLAVDHVSGAAAAAGLSAGAGAVLAAAMLRVEEIAGASAEGARLRVSGAQGELSVLDARVSGVSASAGDAIGVVAVSGGDVALRGVSAAAVEGSRGIGVLVAAAAEVDWMGGDVQDVRGSAAGAAGARVIAAPSPRRVAIQDLQVEAVRAGEVGSEPAPPDSWRSWMEAARPRLLDGGQLPPLPAAGDPGHAEDVVGLHVCAPVGESEPWVDASDPGVVGVSHCVLRRVSGTALQVEGELRDAEVRGVEAWTAIRGGWVDGERVLLAQLTWHRNHTGLRLGPCALTASDSLFTGTVSGAGLVLGDETELAHVAVAFATASGPPFEPEPAPLPYVTAGPAGIPPSVLSGGLAPAVAVDLRLAGDALHRLAERVPGDDSEAPVFVGASAPDAEQRCDLRDPLTQPPAPAAAPPDGAGPFVDYRARDARGLLALMTDRARQVMPGWADTGPADHTTMLLELLANRLDHLAYRQETAVAEGYLGTALLRRSVEDHARLVDYTPGPGLSATALVRFRLGAEGIGELGLAGQFEQGGRLVIPADTLVVNPDATDRLVVFATESDLAFDPRVDELLLADESRLEPGARAVVEPGDTSAVLDGDHPGLEVGRWLAIVATDPGDPRLTDPGTPGHVVRLTRVELGSDTTRVFWDPRRPAPAQYQRDASRVLGNVVPAHHGLPLTPLSAQGAVAVLESDDLLQPWRERLTIRVRNAERQVREVPLPMEPVSVHAVGWPFPGEPARSGRPRMRLSVDGEPWELVDDLSVQGPAAECFALRAGLDGGAVARVGDGANGAALPARDVSVDLAVSIGLGTVGNVGTDTLTRLLALGPGGDADLVIGEGGADRYALVRQHLLVTNPVPAVEGRDPEPLERIRYRAPLGVRDVLSAVAPADYERLLGSLPEVAATRARVVDAGIRQVVRVTLLLRDEDGLAAGGEAGEAERLRRWALARGQLESVRLLGDDVELVPPSFVPLDLDLVVDAEPWALRDSLEHAVTEALAGQGGLFDPDVSGLGGDVHLDAIHRRVLEVPGVAAVRVSRLRRLQPHALERAGSGVLAVGSDEVAVIRHPYGPGYPQGLLTVQVCGVVA
jgi:hypothetical protein